MSDLLPYPAPGLFAPYPSIIYQTEQMLSARTSVASSARMSEDSPQSDRSAPQEGSRSWFDKVFTGMSFRFPDRER